MLTLLSVMGGFRMGFGSGFAWVSVFQSERLEVFVGSVFFLDCWAAPSNGKNQALNGALSAQKLPNQAEKQCCIAG